MYKNQSDSNLPGEKHEQNLRMGVTRLQTTLQHGDPYYGGLLRSSLFRLDKATKIRTSIILLYTKFTL